MSNDDTERLETVLAAARTESGKTLLALVEASPVLLVFLRHFGCTFCREMIARIGELQREFETRGVRPVFVHLGSEAVAQAHFEHYGLKDVERVHDPKARLYQKPVFGLRRTHPLSHFFRWRALKGWLLRGAVFKYGLGMIQNDAEQMPGVFFLRGSYIVRRHVHRSIADQPDYLKLIS